MNQPLSEYLRNKEIRNNLRYICNAITGDEGYELQPGILVSKETVFAMYPISDGKLILWNFNQKGDNPDGTHVR